jgi:hypothetical protein
VKELLQPSSAYGIPQRPRPEVRTEISLRGKLTHKVKCLILLVERDSANMDIQFPGDRLK